MDQTDRRSAHRRVGAATIAAFLVLLLFGATRGPAQADTTVPAAPAATAAPTVEPSRSLPADPDPYTEPDPGFGREHDHDHDGPGFGRGGGDDDDDGDGGGFGAVAPDGGGSGSTVPAPSTSGGSQT